MAEDLSIKVRVEPDVSGVQEKLDKSGTKLHLDVSLFDEKNIDEQVKKIYSAIEKAAASSSRKMLSSVDNVVRSMKLYEAALSDINTMMKTGEVSQKNYAKALAEVAIQQKQTVLLKRSSTLAGQANKLFSADTELKQLREQKKALEEQKKLVKEVASSAKESSVVVSNSLNGLQQDILSSFKNDSYSDKFDSITKLKAGLQTTIDSLSDSIGRDKETIEDAIGDLEELDISNYLSDLQDNLGNIYKTFSDSGKYSDAELSALDNFIKNFKGKLESISDISDNIFGVDSDTLANEMLKSIISTFEGVKNLFNGENAQLGKIEMPKISTAEIDGQLDEIEGKITARQAEILQNVYGMGVEEARNAGVQVGSAFADGIGDAGNKIETRFKNIADTLNIIQNPKTEKGKYQQDRDTIIKTYKALDTELVAARKNVKDLLSSLDLSNFDDESKIAIGQLQNLVDGVGTAQTKLRELFAKSKNGTLSDDDYTNTFKSGLNEISNSVQRIVDISSKLDLGEITKAFAGTNVFSGETYNAGDKLGQQIQLLVQYQTRLTAEKYATAEAEQKIVSGVQDEINSVTALMKLRSELRNNKTEKESDKSAEELTQKQVAAVALAARQQKKVAEAAKETKASVAEVNSDVKKIDTAGLQTVLTAVRKFVDAVCSDQSKVDTVTAKIDDFNRKMATYETSVGEYSKALADLNTYFSQNAIILKALSDAANVPTNATATKTETEQQTAAKVTVLLNKAESSAAKVVEAVGDASEALKGITTALADAAESAGNAKAATAPILEAISSMSTTFTAYANTMKAEVPAPDVKAEEPKEEPVATKQKTKVKEVKDEETVKIASSVTNINKVFSRFKKIADGTADLEAATQKLVSAGANIQKVIKKFNGIDTAAVETAKANKAAGKTAVKTERVPDSLTVDSAQRSYRAAVSDATKQQTFYIGSVEKTKRDSQELKDAVDALTPALDRAKKAKERFEQDGSTESLTAYRIEIRNLEEEVKNLKELFSSVRAEISEETQKFEDRVKALNTRFERAKDKYAEVADRVATAGKNGYKNSISSDIEDRASKALQNANTTKATFDLSPTKNTADALEAQIKELEISTKNLGEETTRVMNNVNAAYRAVQTGLKSSSDTINKLKEQKQKLEYVGGNQEDIDKIDALIARYEKLNEMLRSVDMDNRNYAQITAIFDEFQKDANTVGGNIDSLTSLFAAMDQQVNNTVSGIRQFNAELKNDRNLNTYEKSMKNTLYTAQRFFDSNSKISGDIDAYAKFVNFFDTYQTKIKNGSFTQENANQMSRDWSDLKKYIQDAGLETDKLSVKLKKLFDVNIKSQLANQAINAFQQGLRQVYQNVVDIDSAMTELKKVTDETDSTYNSFLSEAGTRAKTVGSTVSDIINATADYARLGYNLDDAKTLADVSAVYYNVGDDLDSFSTATDNIVGTMKAFNLEADDAIGLVDKLNEVSNNFAVSSGDLGDILQRSASAMEAAGNTLDQTIALGTAMNSVLQSADTTGTTLKVLALRLRGASTELESMGEETDGVATSTSKLREQIAALTNVDGAGGFDILTDTGDFKSTYDIIQGIAKVYSSMSDVDQAALLELIAGKNRANGVAALLNQAAQAEDVLNVSLNSSGSALKENQRVLESVEGKLKKFQATFQSFSSDILNSGVVKSFIDMGTAVLDFADGLVKAGDTIPTIATALSAVLSLTGTKGGVNMPFYAGRIAA